MEQSFKSGFVALIGRPNAGKSTLLNALLGAKVSIVSEVPQTTRYQMRGILNLENAQVVLVDTPGIHAFRKELAAHLNEVARRSTEGIEGVLYVADLTRRPGDEERTVMEFVLHTGLPVIMALNKVDLGTGYLERYQEAWRELVRNAGRPDPVRAAVTLSAKTGKNLGSLLDALLGMLPQSPPYYDTGTLTDFPLAYRLADIVREKLYQQLRRELPHSVAVEVAEIVERGGVLYVRVTVYVNRESQKRIVIGKNGDMIKKVGTRARRDMQDMVRRKVYLDVNVKVVRDWQEKPRILRELGYWWA